MSTFKIRLVTAPNQDTFYRRMNVPRESYVDITETNRVQLKHGGNKWKAHLSASDPNYIKEKQQACEKCCAFFDWSKQAKIKITRSIVWV